MPRDVETIYEELWRKIRAFRKDIDDTIVVIPTAERFMKKLIDIENDVYLLNRGCTDTLGLWKSLNLSSDIAPSLGSAFELF